VQFKKAKLPPPKFYRGSCFSCLNSSYGPGSWGYLTWTAASNRLNSTQQTPNHKYALLRNALLLPIQLVVARIIVLWPSNIFTGYAAYTTATTTTSVQFDKCTLRSSRKPSPQILPVTLSNLSRFKKLFHWQAQQEICYRPTSLCRHSTIPNVCRYTTLWNMNMTFDSRMFWFVVFMNYRYQILC